MRQAPEAELVVAIPGLLDAQCAKASTPTVPSLIQLLSLGSEGRDRAVAVEGGYEGPSMALLSALGDGIDPLADTGWFRCDPVNLHPDRDRLMLFDQVSLSLEFGEAEALIDTLNETYAEEGLRFAATDAGRWYLHWPTLQGLETTPLDDVVARPVDDYLPRGEQARLWQARLSEFQMLFHGHPVNERRTLAGQPACNSLWLWGEQGLYPAFGGDFNAVYADEPVMLGMAGHQGIVVHSLPTQCIASEQAGRTLVFLHRLRDAAVYGDAAQWAEALESLEQDWFEPLLAQWKAGVWRRLTILSGQHRFEISHDKPLGLLARLRQRFTSHPSDLNDFLA